ncbi:hypothetical protein MMC27_003865 [Xylographa pallens]|nr:hypothetical protein [Xylographa pallens]
MQYSVLLSALYASLALAVTVTSPDNTTTWNDSGSNTIKWTSVSTDPSTLNIVLINNAVFPNTQTTIASNVQTSLGSYTVNSLTGNGVGYQVNLMATTNDQILAQSGHFTLSNSSPASGGGSSSSASMSSSTSTSAVASSSSTSLTSMSSSDMSTMSTASTASTGSTASTASTGSTMSTATSSGTATGSAGVKPTSSTASSTAAISTSSGGATMNAISFAGLGLGGLLALLA